jgi:multisubunit Na+/H+ antiporter MnhG subunit
MFDLSVDTTGWVITALVAVVFIGVVAEIAMHWLGAAELTAEVTPAPANDRQH